MIKTTKVDKHKAMEVPYLATDGHQIILISEFCGDQCFGMVVEGDDVGKYSERWDLDNFRPFRGKITLKNK